MQRRVNEIRNAQDLKRIVSDIWSSLPLNYIWSLYASIPRIIRCFYILGVIYQNTQEFRYVKYSFITNNWIFKCLRDFMHTVTSAIYCELIHGKRLQNSTNLGHASVIQSVSNQIPSMHILFSKAPVQTMTAS